MKRLILIQFVLWAFLATFCLHSAMARIWTDSQGRKINAEFIGQDPNDDSKVVLKRNNGKKVIIPISSLSDLDQKYVQNQIKKKEKSDSTIKTTPNPRKASASSKKSVSKAASEPQTSSRKAPAQTSLKLPSTARAAGDRMVKKVGDVEFAFRWCPPGEFMMGSQEGEEGRKKNETYHKVTLTRGFWMQETETTQAQWRAVMGTLPTIEKNFRGDNYPIVQISWHDCNDFCEKLTKIWGTTAKLPTEAQWEYACRAGTTFEFALAPPIPEKWLERETAKEALGWFHSINIRKDKFLHDVGQKTPNPWGICDMHGNADEWCADKMGTLSEADAVDPTGPDQLSLQGGQVIRGGSWYNNCADCRSASRTFALPEFPTYRLGMRFVLIP